MECVVETETVILFGEKENPSIFHNNILNIMEIIAKTLSRSGIAECKSTRVKSCFVASNISSSKLLLSQKLHETNFPHFLFSFGLLLQQH